jgi:hypothetical protein
MVPGLDGWCWNHRPGGEADVQREAARRAGGEARMRATPSIDNVHVTFGSAESITGVLALVAESVLTGRLGPREANAVVYACSVAVRTVEHANIEQELERLRDKIEALKRLKVA